jgi:hypothetical protein
VPARGKSPGRVLCAELRTLRTIARRDGWRGALRLRLRHHSGAHDLHTGLVEARGRITALEHAQQHLEARVAAATGRADAAEQALAAATTAAARDAAELGVRLDALDARLGTLDATTAEARLLALTDATERMLAIETVGQDTLVTVILPTFDRPQLLARAIASVQQQVHREWELLVVDNGQDPGTAPAVAAAADPRIRLIRSDERGSCRARNLALAQARGELIAYLDDDNVMGPVWLRAVAATAARHPAQDAFYGARVDDKPPAPPRLVLDEISAAVLRDHNVVDTSALVHRRAAPVTWPPEAAGLSDWEVVAALTADGRMPLAIPVRAVLYTTSAPGRTTRPEVHQARSDHSLRVVRTLLMDVPAPTPDNAHT